MPAAFAAATPNSINKLVRFEWTVSCAAKVRNASKVGSHELAFTSTYLVVLPGTTSHWIRTGHASELQRPFPQPERPAGKDSKSKPPVVGVLRKGCQDQLRFRFRLKACQTDEHDS